MKKIGIMGGTFNPIHVGHLMLAEWARTGLNLDSIIVMPSGISYLKLGTNVLAGEERLHMVELAIKDNPHMVSSDIEVKRQGNTYTYETLEELKVQMPDAQFYFICGADCLFSIENWKCADRIFANCTLVPAVRNDQSVESMEEKIKELKERFHASIELLPFMNISISSTEVRNRVKEGSSIKYMVPDEVIAYIEEKNFYRG